MCVLLALQRDDQLWIAANRDERRDRPWRPPRLLNVDPPVWGGVDVESRGSWLAFNQQAGFIVGVTNARLGAPPGQRSRGELVVSTACERTQTEAVAFLGEVDLGSYGPFNLMIASTAAVWVASNEPEPKIYRRESAITVLGNDDLAGTGQRTLDASRQLTKLSTEGGAMPRTRLAALLADHSGDDPLCRHGARFGTVSSSILRIGPGPEIEYLFASGQPCLTEFVTVEVPPLRQS